MKLSRAATPRRVAATPRAAVDAERTVREMYERINARDVDGALACVDENVVYEDFNFPAPFRGKAAVKKLFEESCEGIPDDLTFVIDASTCGGDAVGLTWHVELMGEAFPNARGCSFYRVDETNGKLVYARDCVESPLKP